MARKKTAVRSPSVKVIRVNASRPPARRSARTIVVSSPKKVTHRRHHAAGGGGGALTPTRMLSVGLGGMIFGYIEKNFPNMPKLPVVGKSGTIAIAAYFVHKNMGAGVKGIAADVGIAASAIAGYTFGKTGAVAGDDHVSGDDVSFEQI